MAKKDEGKQPLSEMSVVVFRLKGTDQTVQDGIKTISQAISSMLKPSASALPRTSSVAESNDALIDVEAEAITSSTDSEEDVGQQSNDGPKKPAKARKPASYTFVKDLNLRPDGKPSLRDFYNAKQPVDRQEQLAVLLYYLTKTLEKTGVGTNHLYTAWKEVAAPVPPDIAHTARLTANRKNWVDSSKSDDLKLTVTGENFVEHDLPRKKAST